LGGGLALAVQVCRSSSVQLRPLMTGLKKAAALRNKHLPEPEKLLRRGKAATCQPSSPSTGVNVGLAEAPASGDHRAVGCDWKIIILEINIRIRIKKIGRLHTVRLIVWENDPSLPVRVHSRVRIGFVQFSYQLLTSLGVSTVIMGVDRWTMVTKWWCWWWWWIFSLLTSRGPQMTGNGPEKRHLCRIKMAKCSGTQASALIAAHFQARR
ncbi:hypothetical protein T07_7886, partial [Trichinella nelsoni]